MLEIGMVMTDHSPYLKEVDRKNIILPIFPEEVEALDPVVLEMHTKNSLLTDCKALAEGLTPADRPGILKEVDLVIAGWLKQFSKKSHIKLAGSGVGHYDRKFLKRDLRFTDASLTHYSLDIGSTRRQLEIAERPLPETKMFFKSHRAVEDAAMHAQEMRDFFRWARRK
jgi:oligoribonuclease (3'-5' exoribonuclease)